MAIELGKGIGKPTQTPQTREKRGALGKIGEFIAPTTTGLARGLREGEAPTGRQLAGAALEVGSFLIPAGAIARGFGLLGRGAKAVTTAARAGKAARKKTELEALTTGVKEFGTRTRGQLKRGAQVGGVSGAAFETGRALGEEEVSIPEAIGRGAIGGGIGAVGGALLTPVASIVGRVSAGTVRSTSNAFKKARTTLNPVDRKASIDELSEGMSKSFFEDRKAIVNKLEKVADDARRIEGVEFNEQSLLRELVEEGYMPKVDGKLARFGEVIADVKTRRGTLAKGVETLASRIKIKTPLTALRKEAEQAIAGRTDIDILQAERQMNQVFKSLQKEFGSSLDASAVNKLRVKMNRKPKRAIGSEFVQTVQSAVAGATRKRLNDFNPDITRLNAESGRLARVKNTAEALNNETIDVGFFGQALGRFLGVVGASSVGLKVAGSGGLVVAGIMANMGSKTIATLIRQARFNPNAQAIIRQGLRADEKLLKEVLRKATPADRALIERAAGQTPKKAVSIKAPKARGRKTPSQKRQ